METADDFGERWATGALLAAPHVCGEPEDPPEWLVEQWRQRDEVDPPGINGEDLEPELRAVFRNDYARRAVEDEPLSEPVLMATLRERAAEVLVERIARLEREEAAHLAERARTVAALVERCAGTGGDPSRWADASSLAASEITARLKISSRSAKGIVAESLALSDPSSVPVLEGLTAGTLSVRRARTVMDASLPVPADRVAEFMAAAVQIAYPEDPDRVPTPATLSRRLRHLVEEYTEEPLAARKKKALDDRRVGIDPAPDGMCWLTAYMPLEDGAAIDTRLEAVARSLQGPDEGRTLAQLRHDVFRDLLCADPAVDTPGGGQGDPIRASNGRPGAPSGVRCEVILLLPAATAGGTSDVPAELLGYGPLDGGTARQLASTAATWTQLSVDPSNGAPLAVGRSRYTPTAAMRRFLGARDAMCRFPGCDKPAAATEADHTHEWAEGGETDTDNLSLLCREHHRLKSVGYWSVEQIGRRQPAPTGPSQTPASHAAGSHAPPGNQPPPGTLRWTAPSGLTYTTYPYGDTPPPF